MHRIIATMMQRPLLIATTVLAVFAEISAIGIDPPAADGDLLDVPSSLDPVILTWASYPVLPGETATVSGANFLDVLDPNDASVTILPLSQDGHATKSAVNVVPAQITEHAVKFTLPPTLPLDAYNVSVGGSEPIGLNVPDLWWVMGDGGNFSTAGGWIRAFGRGLSLTADAEEAAEMTTKARGGGDDGTTERRDEEGTPEEAVLIDLAGKMEKASRRRDLAELERLAAEQLRLAREGRRGKAKRLGTDEVRPRNNDLITALILTPIDRDRAPLLVQAESSDLSTVSARFVLPPKVTPGTYFVSLSNGAAEGDLDCFVDPRHPHVRTVDIRPVSARAFPPAVFDVAKDYGCKGGADKDGNPIDCTDAVLDAIDAAGKAGGGTVRLDVGRWYVNATLRLPHNVLIKGAGMDKTAIYFATATEKTAPDTHITSADHPGPNDPEWVRFGVEDVSVYVLGYYRNVVTFGADTDGAILRRVRIRANAFHCSNAEERKADWTFRGGGYSPLIYVHGTNFEISDCDLYATWTAIKTDLRDNPTSGGRTYDGSYSARWGVILRNDIRNGGACHWFDNARQILFEGNSCTGNNPMSMGNNIDTYGGGYAHHVYIGRNNISHVWGNDREVMTYDNAGNSYFGPALGMSFDGLTYYTTNRTSAKSFTMRAEGGVLVVINGTGAGQYARVVEAKFGRDVPPPWQFTVNAPFKVRLDSTSHIEVMPLRGRNIFHATHYSDCGALQFYGLGVDSLVYGMTMTRGGGFLSWGQWRGDFANPNLRVQFIGNAVAEGLHADHLSTKPGGAAPYPNFGDPLMRYGRSFVVDSFRDHCPDPDDISTCNDMNRLVVMRRNKVMSNGGFLIGPSTDVLVEGNSVEDTPSGSVCGGDMYKVLSTSAGTFLRDNRP